jgi:hypothetical protein
MLTTPFERPLIWKLLVAYKIAMRKSGNFVPLERKSTTTPYPPCIKSAKVSDKYGITKSFIFRCVQMRALARGELGGYYFSIPVWIYRNMDY